MQYVAGLRQFPIETFLYGGKKGHKMQSRSHFEKMLSIIWPLSNHVFYSLYYLSHFLKLLQVYLDRDNEYQQLTFNRLAGSISSNEHVGLVVPITY